MFETRDTDHTVWHKSLKMAEIQIVQMNITVVLIRTILFDQARGLGQFSKRMKFTKHYQIIPRIINLKEKSIEFQVRDEYSLRVIYLQCLNFDSVDLILMVQSGSSYDLF
jgi:hypothetical protein